MARRKKRGKPARRSARRPSRKVMRAVDEAMELFEDGEAFEARRRLEEIIDKRPRSKQALYALLEVSQEMDDWNTFAEAAEQLLPLERGEDRIDALNNLVVAYTKLVYPALAWQTARQFLEEFPNYSGAGKFRGLAQELEGFLNEEVDTLLPDVDLPRQEKLEVLVAHDRIRLCTESSRAEEAVDLAQEVLEKVPGLIPVLNNLSLASYALGRMDEALMDVEKVLAQDPDNFHALSNATRFSFATAQFAIAEQYAARLKEVGEGSPELETKQAEALSFLGDDAGVIAAYQQAKERHGEYSSLLLHLAAVAYYRTGDEKAARGLWRQAMARKLAFPGAVENFEDLQRPVGEREMPWYWPMQYWLPRDFWEAFSGFMTYIEKTRGDAGVERGVERLLAKYPYLPELMPHILERSDGDGRKFVVGLAGMIDTPEMADMLYDFATSRWGSDAIRMEALRAVQQIYPERLPADKKAPMWLNGKDIEIFSMAFEITDEPSEPNIDEAVHSKFVEATELLQEGEEIEEAEAMLKEVVAEAPDFPSAYNQLALAYQMQERQEEAISLTQEVLERFPDYVFARTAMASHLSHQGDVEGAKALLDPLMTLEKLHISEFRALAQAEIRVALADDQKEAARSWLEMWRGVDEDDPALLGFEMEIEGKSNMMKKLRRMLGRD